ncbi:MAG: adenylyltransferase/cytidyltransferase family protein [bacterium]
MKTILFIGRFQPFHIGHLSVLKKIDKRNDVKKIIIGIGSAQYSNTQKNPYSFEQRKKMIVNVCKSKIKKSITVIPLDDFNNNAKWVKNVEKMAKIFNEAYSGNDLVTKLLSERGYLINKIDKSIDISATKIREMIKKGDIQWKKYIPYSDAEIYN